MNIAISISENKCESSFDPRFGRATAFCLVDSKTGDRTVHENLALSAVGGAGVKAAQLIVKLGAQVIISGAYGPNAFKALSPAGVEMYLASAGEALTVTDVLALFNAGKLEKAEAATHAGHHGS